MLFCLGTFQLEPRSAGNVSISGTRRGVEVLTKQKTGERHNAYAKGIPFLVADTPRFSFIKMGSKDVTANQSDSVPGVPAHCALQRQKKKSIFAAFTAVKIYKLLYKYEAT